MTPEWLCILCNDLLDYPPFYYALAVFSYALFVFTQAYFMGG